MSGSVAAGIYLLGDADSWARNDRQCSARISARLAVRQYLDRPSPGIVVAFLSAIDAPEEYRLLASRNRYFSHLYF